MLITKSSDFKSVLISGQTSKPYSKTGKHLLLTSCNIISSDAIGLYTFPRTTLAAQ